ncbi:prephenate dehydrogenase [Acetivibrio cellulolyticus]|uniref:prephenate dehydrogenase n=1 Tax=Acetivibrio cellulolyticus TaxID=35830 RepID=UPI0001E30562|nr:prephenate dehydrogenase [Acetivibrio cellulolyticus]
MAVKKVTVIGLGLIGGSLAKALKERLDITDITAVDISNQSLDQALKEGYVSHGYTELNDDVYNSDLIFVCTPVKNAIEYIKKLAKKVGPDCLITDVASTKSEIVNFVNSMDNPPRFIGGHPMAGTEKSGFMSSLSHLFENAYYILTPAKSTQNTDIETMRDIINHIGGLPVVIDAEDHDFVTATISHVPHIIASALVNLVGKSDYPDGKMQTLAAGGFKDITRIASSSPEMWENVVLSNKQKIKGVLDTFVETLYEFKQRMDDNDSKGINNYFSTAKELRDSIPDNRKGLLISLYEVIVDVVDKPGIIGEIATILGNNGINIKNINVSNSREFEQGCLRITLPDSESVKSAVGLLSNQGYKVYKI